MARKRLLRFIFPYDWVRGEPNKHDHNKFGFRGNSPDIERDPEKLLLVFLADQLDILVIQQ